MSAQHDELLALHEPSTWAACTNGDNMLRYIGDCIGPQDSDTRRTLALLLSDCLDLLPVCGPHANRLRQTLRAYATGGQSAFAVQAEADAFDIRKDSKDATDWRAVAAGSETHAIDLQELLSASDVVHRALHAVWLDDVAPVCDLIQLIAVCVSEHTRLSDLSHVQSYTRDTKEYVDALAKCADIVRKHYPSPPDLVVGAVPPLAENDQQ